MCAAIPVIKVLRESLVVTNVHRVLGIVNGTTNFILTAMEGGRSYARRARRGAAARLRRGRPDRRRRRARRRGEDGDPRDGRVRLARAARLGRGRGDRGRHARARRGGARSSTCVVRLVGRGDARRRPRRRPRRPGVRRPPPSARGGRGRVQRRDAPGRRDPRDHARGPGRGRDRDGVAPSSPTWSSIVGTTGTGFLQNDPVWRELERLPAGRARARPSTCGSRSTTGPACSPGVAQRARRRRASRSRGSSSSRPTATRCSTSSPTRRPRGSVEAALAAIRALPESRGEATALPGRLERGVAELGWA